MADIQVASVQRSEGELPESIGSGERLCAGIPGNGVLAWTGLGEHEDAVGYFNQAIADADRTIGDLDYDLIGYRAEAETKAGQYEDAIAS